MAVRAPNGFSRQFGRTHGDAHPRNRLRCPAAAGFSARHGFGGDDDAPRAAGDELSIHLIALALC
jgi:hypothetical protein